MPTTVLVERLLSCFDPFYILDLDVETDDPMSYDPIVEFSTFDQRTRDYHLGRIRYFVDRLLLGEELDPVEIDNACAGMRVLPVPVLLDGHHRLCAAAIVGARAVRASYGGRVDVKNWLSGRRASRPEE